MRIIGGTHKGRTLATPDNNAIRPTSDRVREAMFNILAHSTDGFSFQNIRVLDLFAGTGALGLEALSRGAKFVQFIDDNASARALVRTNAETLGATGQVKIWRRDAANLALLDSIPPFDLVFIDPPYCKGLGGKALAGLVAGKWLNQNAIIVLEEDKSAQITLPENYAALSRRDYGDTQARFLRFAR